VRERELGIKIMITCAQKDAVILGQRKFDPSLMENAKKIRK